jgi:hypothetical protein
MSALKRPVPPTKHNHDGSRKTHAVRRAGGAGNLARGGGGGSCRQVSTSW